MAVRHALLAASGAAIALAVATPASANGRFPATNQLYFSPSDPQLVVLRTTFGILPSHDYGATWTWLCEDSLGLGPTTNEDPTLALTGSNALVAGLSLGLETSPDTGCSWSTAGGALKGQLVKDLVVPRASPHTVFAITSTFGPAAAADGGAGYTQQIFTSTDDGGHWSAIATLDPSAIVTTLDVAPSDPQRFYVSAFRGDGTSRTASLFVSTDGGATWVERPTPFDPAHESAVYIAAVDPANADRVYVRSEGASRLMVTVDAGKTFQVPLSLDDEMAGFALSQDGATVYAGGPNAGLYAGAAADLVFTPVLQQAPDGGTRSIHVQCLATHGTDLWACSDEPSGFVAGVSQDGGKTFTPKLHLTTILGALSCPAGTAGAACSATDFDANPPYNPFGSLCTNLGVCFDGGAHYPLSMACVEAGACGTYFSSGSGGGSGSGSGSASGGSGGGPGDDGGTGGGSGGGSKSCGCTQVGGGGAAGGVAAAALVIAALRRRRARR